jgi:hypothetical protein
MKYISYWWRHWKAYQKVAIDLGVWRWRFIFHDADKIILMSILDSEKAQAIHERNSRHHFTGPGKKYDYLGMVIDWECSRFTKPHAQKNACSTLHDIYPNLIDEIEPILIKLGINERN